MSGRKVEVLIEPLPDSQQKSGHVDSIGELPALRCLCGMDVVKIISGKNLERFLIKKNREI